MQGILLFNAVCGVLFLELATASLDPNGTHVCSVKQSYSEGYVVSHQASHNKQVSYKCRNTQQIWQIYKTCYKNVVTYVTAYKQMYRKAYRTVHVCCSGWQQTGKSCTTPICSQDCINGQCTKPEVCMCYPGYQGATCAQSCLINKWGLNCNNTCQCKNNATCDMRNGSCSCTPGWRGDLCQLTCQQGFYGNKCLQKCACHNGASCDHVTGRCNCTTGWFGTYCRTACSSGYYGYNCKQTCRCQNNATCDHVTGDCSCRPGYDGTFCDRCKRGYYGDRCDQKCPCARGSCNRLTGACSCPAGFIGKSCDERCPVGLYGLNCTLSCLCSTSSKCKPDDGSCVCNKGFTGQLCKEQCSRGYYGTNCQSQCSCHDDMLCDPVDGSCNCPGDACEGHKSRTDKRTEDPVDPTLPIILSVTVIAVIAAVIIGFVVYRKRRAVTKEPKAKINDRFSESTDVTKRDDDDGATSNRSSYTELSRLQVAINTPLYQGLNPAQSRDRSRVPRSTNLNQSGNKQSAYQPLTAHTVIYQPLNKNSNSPAVYENSHGVQNPVDEDGELYLTVLPDQTSSCSNPIFDKNPRISSNVQEQYGNLPNEKSRVDNADDEINSGRSNPAFDENPRTHESSSASPVLYENLPCDAESTNEDELYLTVLSDSDVVDQPTYEILPKNS